MLKSRELDFKNWEGKSFRGKLLKGYVALYISEDYWILAKGYSLYKYDPISEKIQFFSRLDDKINSFASRFRLTRRFLRAEITKLYHYGDAWFCIARKGIFKYNSESGNFELCHIIERGSRPLNLCRDKDGTIYYGEYFSNPGRTPVGIFASKDLGNTWHKVYVFEDKEINHIHGLFLDKFTDRLWVFTGDDDQACIAGYTTDGFQTFVHEFEGKQEYRVCVPLFRQNSIIYPTDSQYVLNTIRQIDRQTKQIKDLATIQGSGIYATDAGKFLLVSTTVEPSKINTDRSSHLWYSRNGEQWHELLSFPKDWLNRNLFQFGSIRFPNYAQPSDYIVITGRALKGLDQSTLVIPLNQIQR